MRIAKPLLTAAAIALAGALFNPGPYAAPAPAPAAGRIAKVDVDPKAEALLREMCTRIQKARQFTVTGNRIIDEDVLREVPWIHYTANARFEASVSRPDKMRVKVTGGKDRRELYSDGKMLGLLDLDMNTFMIVPNETTIEGTLERISNKFGIKPPMSEFMTGDPYANLLRGVSRGQYNGTTEVGPVKCELVLLEQALFDRKIWIGAIDKLPRRFEIIFKFADGRRPRFVINFSDWNLTPDLKPEDFVLEPPEKATRVDTLEGR